MNPDTVIGTFARTRADHPHGPALFHSRYATRGAIDLSNCHPFHLGGDARTVLAHNGTLPKRVHPRAYDRRSDTRIAAEDYLPTQPFGPIDTVAGARGLLGWLGTSKLVILTVDPAYAHTAYVFGERAGQWVGGIWYSNRSYCRPSSGGRPGAGRCAGTAWTAISNAPAATAAPAAGASAANPPCSPAPASPPPLAEHRLGSQHPADSQLIAASNCFSPHHSCAPLRAAARLAAGRRRLSPIFWKDVNPACPHPRSPIGGVTTVHTRSATTRPSPPSTVIICAARAPTSSTPATAVPPPPGSDAPPCTTPSCAANARPAGAGAAIATASTANWSP
ncbi:class II glutamine amidotransferase [Nocardia kruczakiae]|uniref:class II glutamine amidotransferase n=1 Tax=Nocardia kruczakiae TaxID=261477 RepID=UPI001FDF2F33|nr:class II glutamine amidotransferase [Nocardia kruczakiae]